MRLTRSGSSFVYQLTFMPSLFPVNCYLVEEEDGLTLIDAALPNSADAISKAAESIGKGKPVARIVLTHAHGDHIGALDALKIRFPAAAVCISARDARLLAGERSLDSGEPNTPLRGGIPKPGAIRTVPDTLLQDGDRIGSLLAVAAPGHTPGSMAFLDERSGALIAGDAFQTRGGVAVSGHLRPWFPFPAWATWNKEASVNSARKLLALNPSVLAVGHGDLLQEPAAAMRQAIAEAEKQMNTSKEK
ncbi:MBL fold metallo-hydrolase [Paenibacillus sp. NEAU-GSW1]|uniref:MBL fold metallo-hydrolase n=1 Tax=Paenibacillus sp. NEAU-GSW1 TaxID=2682486 RepID=UPI0012E11F91|nr:MBL fold metallo-hydrolase [Paenibacillus sp. NEAU-GSW1]MUT67589.1 MBL fold metallo-hydrolase [Paenibacillus sp. NEAU-GSW1]